MSQFTDVPVVTKCNTCKAAFSSVELIRDHYRSDWHVLNSKRRASGLAHVSLTEYRRQFPNKKKSSGNTGISASRSMAATGTPLTVETQPSALSEPRENKPSRSNESKEVSANPQLVQSFTEMAMELGVEGERLETVVSLALASEAQVDNSDDEGAEEMEEETEPIVVEPTVSIFDDAEFETVEECIAHMETKFGFFIPEREYLTDTNGFLVYLGEKVKLGGICLYCQKQFRPGRPLQNHMQSKSHCKIAYEEGVDMDEFEDFYDFSSSYGETGANGGGDDDKDEELDEEDGLEITSTGELLLTDGRRIGHRAFRRYYKQRYTAADTRDAVTAQRREDLLRFCTTNVGGKQYSITGRSAEVRNLSDYEVMNLMVRHHKEMRKMQVIEQRAARRQDYRVIRMEFNSVKDKLRSSQNTTAKIRDYHARLM